MKVTDLVDGAGSAIEADNLELRAVRWVKVAGKEGAEAVPLLLERFERETVPAGQVQQFWVTYYVPEDARPGTYEGQVHITVGGEEKLALPLRLRVNPFRLAGARIGLAGARVDTYIYYSHSASPEELGLVYKELVDQRCHGMNTGTLSPPVTRSGEVSREAMAALLDVYRSARFASRRVHVELWNRIASEWLNQPDRTIGMWGPWFRYYPFNQELDARYVATVRMIKEEAEKRGLELVLSVADEPGSHPWTTDAAQHYNDLVKARVPGVLRELTVGGGWAMGRREEELWRGRINIWTSNRWLPEEFATVRRDDPQARIALYNMAGGGSGPGGPETARLFYGFYCWKTKAAGVSQWVYYHDATPADNYVWPAQDASEGRVPTVRWEAVREGVKDRLYLATLEDLLTGRADKDADRARKLLDEIAWAIALEPPASESGGGRARLHPAGTYDAWRQRIMDAIQALGIPTTKR